MKRTIPIKHIAVVLVVLLLPGFALAAKKDKSETPTALVFGGPVGKEPGLCDKVIFDAAMKEIDRFGCLKTVYFNPDMPSLEVAVKQKKLEPDFGMTINLPATQAKVLSVVGLDYGLRIYGSIEQLTEGQGENKVRRGDKVVVTVDLFRKSGEHMSVKAESRIPPGSSQQDNARKQVAASTAASVAFSQLAIQAFGQDAVMNSWSPVSETPASQARTEPDPDDVPRDYKAEYTAAITKADELGSRGDLPSALMVLRRAVNIQPSEVQARLKLAQVYSDLRMHNEAVDECKRALLFGKDNLSVYDMLARLYLANGSLPEASRYWGEVIRIAPGNVDAYLGLGEIYLNQSRVDDAETAFRKASELGPENSGPYEQLQKLYATKKQYADAVNYRMRAELASEKIKPGETAAYGSAAQVVKDEFDEIMGKLTAADEQFKKNSISKEDYYAECRDIAARIDALDAFVSEQTANEEFRQAHPHAVLAVSLLAQSNGCTISYLETEKKHYAEQAVLLRIEAKTELGIYTKSVTTRI